MRVVSQFLAQLADEHIDTAIDRRPISPAQPFQYGIAGKNLLAVIDKSGGAK